MTYLQADGSTRVVADGHDGEAFGSHMFKLKHLHIPKLLVPTGLSDDGRPTAVQLWGRAVPYAQMFDDEAAAVHDASFLHLAKKVAAAIQAQPDLRRVDAPMVVRDLRSPSSQEQP